MVWGSLELARDEEWIWREMLVPEWWLFGSTSGELCNDAGCAHVTADVVDVGTCMLL
jgi:hypothetical protein